MGRQPVGFFAGQIDHKGQRNPVERIGPQQTDAARLDQATDGGGGAGKQSTARFGAKLGSVVGNEAGAQRDHSQRKAGLARSRRPGHQDGPAAMGYAGGMQHQNPRARGIGIWCSGHTGKPTTKRAPRGSEFRSAAVGRMFSAQITPPCASTICFEIESPRPELLPKWVGGRSE